MITPINKRSVILATVVAFQVFTLVITILSDVSHRQPLWIIISLIVLGVLLDYYIYKSFLVMNELKEKEEQLKQTAILQKEMAQYRMKAGNDLVTLEHLQDNYIAQLENIKEHLSSGKTELDREISETSDSLRDAFSELYTDNTIVNTILVLKRAAAAESGIDVSYSVSMPEEIPFTELDMCTLLCNMLDNAIEAAIKCPPGSGYLKLRIKPANNYLFVSTKNSVINDSANDFSKTSKASSAEHGFGLELIHSIAEKYHGHLSISRTSPGEVQVIVALSLNLR